MERINLSDYVLVSPKMKLSHLDPFFLIILIMLKKNKFQFVEHTIQTTENNQGIWIRVVREKETSM